MEIVLNSLLFVIGLLALYLGGEGLVKGSSRLARKLGISPIVIGLTIVAAGTSSPELVVSLTAAFRGASDLAIGNIVGSNISNIGLILGISALIYPITVKMKLLKAEVPIMILLSLILYLTAINLIIGTYEGIILIVSLLAFVIYGCFNAVRETSTVKREFEDFLGTSHSTMKNLLFIIFGIIGLIIGARLVVNAAIVIANKIGISELVIGISAVAIGTSLPELSTSIVAAIRKEPDILVGNIIGSNIFNIGILGLVAIIHPVNVDPSLLKFELPVMLLFTVATLPIMKTGFQVSRVEGISLLAFYLLFIVLLFYL